jgi:hypothetical protein
LSDHLKAQFGDDKGLKTKRCGFCQIQWPKPYVSNVLTAKVLREAYDTMVGFGLPTGSIIPPNYDSNVADEHFYVNVRNVAICQTCSQLVSVVNENAALSKKMEKAVGTVLPK